MVQQGRLLAAALAKRTSLDVVAAEQILIDLDQRLEARLRVVGPDGNLYVGSNNTNSILRYDGMTGDFIDTFATGGGASGLSEPMSVVFGPDGNLYVAGFSSHNVVRYNGTTGAFMDVFVAAGSGGLNSPEDMTFGPDGNLYVTSPTGIQELERFDGTNVAARIWDAVEAKRGR